MGRTIMELWNGVAPCEHCGSHDPEANRLVRDLARHREALCDGLAGPHKEAFERYVDCAETYLLRMMELAFCDGFRLGGRLTAEMLND